MIVDRVNIGGNENGQQANFVGQGRQRRQHQWNLDGVVITDTGAVGASPTYFDFDAFEEIYVTTGGTDLRVQTGGVGHQPRHPPRHQQVPRLGPRLPRPTTTSQSSNLPDELVGDPRLQGSDKGDHIEQISDYGFDLGGPIVKDKLWFYGSYGKQDIRLVRINQTADKTKLDSYNAKLNWQATASDMISVFYFNGAKKKYGRCGRARRPGGRQLPLGPGQPLRGRAPRASSRRSGTTPSPPTSS